MDEDKEIQELLKKIKGPRIVSANAVRRLDDLAIKGRDISEAVPHLENALKELHTADVQSSAAKALVSHHLNKKNWKKIEELFGHKNDFASNGALIGLHIVHFKKELDITPLIPAVQRLLFKERHNKSEKETAVKILTYHYACKGKWDIVNMFLETKVSEYEEPNIRGSTIEGLMFYYTDNKKWDEAKKLIEDKDGRTRFMARLGLESVVHLKGTDISPLIPSLPKNKKEFNEEEWIADLLCDAAEKGTDISVVIPEIMDKIEEKTSRWVWRAAKALTYHYTNREMWTEVIGLLEYDNRSIKDGAVTVAYSIIRKGTDISPILESVGKLFGDKDETIVKRAAGTIYEAAKRGIDVRLILSAYGNGLKEKVDDESWIGDYEEGWLLSNNYAEKGVWDKVEELLMHKDDAIKLGALEGLEDYIGNLVNKKIEEKDYTSALVEIKEITNRIMKIFNGRKEVSKRRKMIGLLNSLAEEVQQKMNSDKKTFPMKKQEIKPVRKQVIRSG